MSVFFKRKEGHGLFDNIMLYLVNQYEDYDYWHILIQNHNISLDIVRKKCYDLDSDVRLFLNPNIDLKFIKEYTGGLYYDDILSSANLDFTQKETWEFIEKIMEDNEYWFDIARNPNLTFEFVKKHQEKFLKTEVLSNENVFDFSKPEILDYFENYIIKNMNIDYGMLSNNTTLTLEFVEKYKHLLDWRILSYSLELDFSKKETCQFFAKYINKFDWEELSYNTSLSIEFIEKHLDKFKIKALSGNPALTIEFIEKHLDILDRRYLLFNPSLTVEFIEKNFDDEEIADVDFEFWGTNRFNLHPIVLA